MARKRRWPREQRERAVAAYLSEGTYQKAAEVSGIPWATIASWKHNQPTWWEGIVEELQGKRGIANGRTNLSTARGAEVDSEAETLRAAYMAQLSFLLRELAKAERIERGFNWQRDYDYFEQTYPGRAIPSGAEVNRKLDELVATRAGRF